MIYPSYPKHELCWVMSLFSLGLARVFAASCFSELVSSMKRYTMSVNNDNELKDLSCQLQLSTESWTWHFRQDFFDDNFWTDLDPKLCLLGRVLGQRWWISCCRISAGMLWTTSWHESVSTYPEFLNKASCSECRHHLWLLLLLHCYTPMVFH